jgi:putative cardiolipin synthase
LVRGTASLNKNLFASCLVALLTGCGGLPSLENRIPSVAATDTEATALGGAIGPRLAQHPGRSGIRTLADGHDAFAARMLLARAAERTLDVQYYIWHDDNSGRMLLAALHAAAGRGVRVRLLLDDNGIAGLDETLAALHAHPNVEVRLFNPFVLRSSRALGYLTDFSRLNRGLLVFSAISDGTQS